MSRFRFPNALSNWIVKSDAWFDLYAYFVSAVSVEDYQVGERSGRSSEMLKLCCCLNNKCFLETSTLYLLWVCLFVLLSQSHTHTHTHTQTHTHTHTHARMHTLHVASAVFQASERSKWKKARLYRTFRSQHVRYCWHRLEHRTFSLLPRTRKLSFWPDIDTNADLLN